MTETQGVHWWQVSVEAIVDSTNPTRGRRYRLALLCRYSLDDHDLQFKFSECDSLSGLLGSRWNVEVALENPQSVTVAGTSSERVPEREGEIWRVKLDLRRIGNKRSSGFDRARWAISEGIVASGLWNDDGAYRMRQAGPIDAWRHRIQARLNADSAMARSAFSQLDSRPLINALTLGDRSGLSAQHWSLLQASGTSHLMAISGLHLGIVAGWLFWFTGVVAARSVLLGQWVSPNLLATACALFGSLLYGLLVGFPLPTQRAFLMLCFAALVILINRAQMVIHGIALAFLLIIIWWPFSLLSASLWLSFAAISLVFWVIANRVIFSTAGFAKLGVMLKLQLTMFLGMLPLSAYYFDGVSLNSLLANLVAIPLVTGIILPSCFVAAMSFELLPAFSAMVSEFNLWLMDCLLTFLGWLTENIGFREIAFETHRLLLALVAALLIFAPLFWGVRMLGIVIYCSAFLIPGSVATPRVLLLDQSAPFLVFREAEQVHILDETPGISFAERAGLRKYVQLAPIAGTDQYWLHNWMIDHWWQASLSHGAWGKAELRDLCVAASLSKDNLHISPLRVGSQDGANHCVLGINWQGFHWLLLGDLPSAAFRELRVLDWISNNQWDFVVLSGDNIPGAFLNLVEGATVFLWAGRELTASMRQRFAARDIALFQPSQVGPVQLSFNAQGYEIEQLVSPRFYD